MTIERVRSALMKLERRGSVEKVLSLMEVRTNPALAMDPDYQRTFNGYYKMGRKKGAFLSAFLLDAPGICIRSLSSLPRDNSAKPIRQYRREAPFFRHENAGD